MDWLVLFLQPHLHVDTLTRALRLLCQLLREHTLMQRFLAGEVFGGWLHGMESLCPEMCVKFERSKFNPLRSSVAASLPGVSLLTHLLPRHPQCSRALLILFGLMLGTPPTEVPPSGMVDVETMDSIFSLKATKGPVCYDAAFILLAVVKDMLHNVSLRLLWQRRLANFLCATCVWECFSINPIPGINVLMGQGSLTMSTCVFLAGIVYLCVCR